MTKKVFKMKYSDCGTWIEMTIPESKRWPESIVLFDSQDKEIVNPYGWGINYQGYVYASYVKSRCNEAKLLMHRLIMGLTVNDGKIVDHANMNRLDNRRSNLRLCTRSQNQFNQKPGRSKKSPYKGVCYDKGRWMARISMNGKKIFLGIFDTPEQGAMAYDAAAKIHHGEFAKTNF